ncbi:MAG: RNHCP domain-containing protein [Patescibacteria group bacterium]|jgi:hypothetical protein
MKNFQKIIEDFKCEHCGFSVKGTGYTNHCPQCFYSKHVDIVPGDRKNDCQGMMRPVAIEFQRQKYSIISRCEKCGELKRNKVAEEDNMDNLIKLQKEINEKITKQ